MTSRAWLPLAVVSACAALSSACTSPSTPTFLLNVGISGNGDGAVAASGAASSDGSVIDCKAGSTTGCESEYDQDAQVTLTATAGANSKFVSWAGACTGTTPTCDVTMSQAQNVTAQFSIIEDNLTVVISGSGTGAVTSSPAGIDYGNYAGAGSQSVAAFDQGSTVTLTAAPLPNMQFVGWSGGCTGTNLSCQVPISQMQTVTAQFNVIMDPVQVMLAGTGFGNVTSTDGAISCGNFSGASNHCSETVDQGGMITLKAAAQPNSDFTGWSGACTGTGDCLVDVTQAQSVTANFSIHQLTAPLVSSISMGQQAQGQVQGLALKYYIAVTGVFPAQGGGINSTGSPYLGQIMLFAGNFAPDGWLACDGSLLPISQYTALFSLIGTSFGGNGTTNFALPDLRDRVAMEPGTLDVTPPAIVPGSSQVPVIASVSQGATGQGQVNAVGINYYIALQGVYPSQGSGGALTSGYYVGQLMLFAGGFAPGGWALANGQLLPINQNQALFSLLGTQFGGNGTSTFALPNLQGRVPMGVGSLTNPTPPPTSPYQVPLIPSIAWGSTAQGQLGVLGMNYSIALQGIFPPRGGSGSAAVEYLGQVMLFAFNFAPGGYAQANGQLLPISQNTALFSILGTQYGGNGTSTFALPDLAGRVAMSSP
jgi:microcystin-dependent protein